MTDRSSRPGRDDGGLHSPLPIGTRIREYVIEKVLGNGGFGITYLARHATIDRLVAIKEHFPREFAYRTGITVRPSGNDDEIYDWARAKFLDEARVLARFDHPAIVKVLDVFEENGTAYMVQGFEAGRSLGDWLKSLGRRPTERELDDLVFPLLDALEVVHDEGLLHRDIAPDNIIIRRDGRPCLIDFGAARGILGQRTRTVAVVKPGYSPPEQYATDSKLQGPWTDIYALGATLYYVVTGAAPQVATLRGLDDDHEMQPATTAARGDWRPEVLTAIDSALAMRPSERPQSIAEWRELFHAEAPESPARAARNAPSPRPAPAKSIPASGPRGTPLHVGTSDGPTTPAFPWHWFVLGAGVLVALSLAGHWLLGNASRFSATECDRLAASPTDPGRSMPAVEWQTLDGEAVVSTCRQELDRIAAAFKPRIGMQLGRGHERLKQFAEAARAYRTAATGGNVEAMARLGDLHYGGLGVARDLAEACRLFERAANGGHAEAMSSWAFCLERGLGGTSRNRAKAAEWQRQAMARGHADAEASIANGFAGAPTAADSAQAVRMLASASAKGSWEASYWLAEHYDQGDGVARDTTRASQLFSEVATRARALAAAHRGNGHYYLGLMHYNGRGLGLDHAAAARHFREAASLGQHNALTWLGALHERGEGVKQDHAEARRLYEEAIAAGDHEALVNLSGLHRDGLGVPKNPAEARKLLDRAIALDVTSAVHNLAYMHEEGLGGPVDHATALRLYRQATELGHAASFDNIGTMHLNGRGVAADPVEAVRWFRRGAERGDPGSLESLAILHQEGRGVARDDAEAARLLLRAAERGHVRSMSRLAQAFRDGRGVGKNPTTALWWLHKATALGDGEAMNTVGVMHEIGEGVPADAAEAAKWYRRAIEKGDAAAMDNLGALFEDGRGVTRSLAEALRLYRQAAAKDNTSAMIRLGHAHREGRLGLAKSPSAAIDWYTKAAAKGEGDAFVALGAMHENGEGVTANPATAAGWYQRGAAAGSGEAETAFGRLLLEGRGVAQDQAKAIAHFRSAADKGVASAMYWLGRSYGQGTGVIRNLAEAHRWLNAAVAKGDIDAMNLLGVMLAGGEGVTADPAAAARLFQRAAEKGQQASMFNLAVLLEEGRGIAKNCRDATSWFQRSAAAGYAEARRKIADGSLARCR